MDEWERNAVAVLEAAEGGIRVYYGVVIKAPNGVTDNIMYRRESSTRYLVVNFDDEGYSDVAVRYSALTPDQQASLRRIAEGEGYELWPEHDLPSDEELRAALTKLEASE